MKDSYCADQGRCSCYKKQQGFVTRLRLWIFAITPRYVAASTQIRPGDEFCGTRHPNRAKLFISPALEPKTRVVAKEGLACGGLGHMASAQRSTMPSWRKASRNSLATCYDDDSGGTTPTPWPLAIMPNSCGNATSSQGMGHISGMPGPAKRQILAPHGCDSPPHRRPHSRKRRSGSPGKRAPH